MTGFDVSITVVYRHVTKIWHSTLEAAIVFSLVNKSQSCHAIVKQGVTSSLLQRRKISTQEIFSLKKCFPHMIIRRVKLTSKTNSFISNNFHFVRSREQEPLDTFYILPIRQQRPRILKKLGIQPAEVILPG